MTVIFTETPNGTDNGNQSLSFRSVCPITGNAQGQVRATFQASSSVSGDGDFTVDHCSIGVSTQSTVGATGAYDTTATPVELTFSGGHGFNLTTDNQTITSDWVTLAGFTTSNLLVVTIDQSSTGGGSCRSNTATGVQTYYITGATYNEASPGGSFSEPGVDNIWGLVSIETQAGSSPTPPTRTLMGVGS